MTENTSSRKEPSHMKYPQKQCNSQNKKQLIRLNGASFLLKVIPKYSSTGNIHRDNSQRIITKNSKFMSMTNHTFGSQSKSKLKLAQVNPRTTYHRFAKDIQSLKDTAKDIIKSLRATQLNHYMKFKSHSTNYKEIKPLISKNSFITSLKNCQISPDNEEESVEKNKTNKIIQNNNLFQERLSKNDDKNNSNEAKINDVPKPKIIVCSLGTNEEKIHKPPNYRKRLLRMTKDELLKRSHKIYFIPIVLAQSKCSFSDTSLQKLAITDQFKLIEANIIQFKYDYLYSTYFLKAFYIQDENNKQKFNLLLEETSTLLFNVVPRLIKKVYDRLDEVLYCKIPILKEEINKLFSNEDECFIIDCKWFGEVSAFFSGCCEVFDSIKNKQGVINFNTRQYFIIKVYLDSIRFNTNALISSSKAMIATVKHDKKMLYEFEAEIGLKPKLIKNISCDTIERYHHKERKLNEKHSYLKKIRIKAALDSEKEFEDYQRTLQKSRQNNGINSQISLLTTPLIISMLPFYDKNTREQIIAYNVVERYHKNELENQKLILTKEQELQRQQQLSAHEKV